jgi:hypothetical protein
MKSRRDELIVCRPELSAGRRFRGVFGVCSGPKSVRYLCGTVERVAECETVEIANVHAVFMYVAENKMGYSQRRREYPTNLTQTKDFYESFTSLRLDKVRKTDQASATSICN